MFEVTQANFLALIQDRGRNARSLGFTSGGAMDMESYYLANQLVANKPGAAAIEITYGAFAIRATEAAWVALAGADLSVRHNSDAAPQWQNFLMRPGDTLMFIQPKSGLRVYLAVAGGFQTLSFLGSRSAVIREKLLGFCGRKLQKGDKLAVLPQCESSAIRSIPEFYRPIPKPNEDAVYELPFYPSCQWAQCSIEQQQKFTSAIYSVTDAADRMGYRLAGPVIDMQGLRLVSEGIVVGSIQVPADGQPIVLMRDHQTIGGYPKLGVVTEAGINLLSQLKPGEKVKFTVPA